jgi:hypothetical protein
MMNLKIRENVMNTGRKRGSSLCVFPLQTYIHTYFTLLPAAAGIFMVLCSVIGNLEGRTEGWRELNPKAPNLGFPLVLPLTS